MQILQVFASVADQVCTPESCLPATMPASDHSAVIIVFGLVAILAGIAFLVIRKKVKKDKK